MVATGWKQFTPFYIYAAASVCFIGVIGAEGLSWIQLLLLLGSGIMTWLLIEYGLHRFIFHYDAHSALGQRILHRTHLAHHENPGNTKLLSGIVLGLAIAPEIVLVAWAITGSWRAAFYFLNGVAAGYFYYEWLHFYVHHSRTRLKLFRYLRTYHLLHHHQTTEMRFGVTSPLIDLIFGTYRSVGNRLSQR